MAEAVGILEVFGLTTAFVAGDAGCKAANVRLEVFDKNKPANADSLPVPLLVCIKFRGSVEDVTAAVLERKRIEHERDHDILTGLYNRQAFNRVCTELFAAPERMGVAALMMMD